MNTIEKIIRKAISKLETIGDFLTDALAAFWETVKTGFRGF